MRSDMEKKRAAGAAISLAVLMSAALVFSAPSSLPEPAQTLREFYDAVNRHDCAAAIKLRPDDYSLERCRSTRSARVKVAETTYQEENAAIVYLEVDAEKASGPESFKGFVTLRREAGRWMIVGKSYQSGVDMETYKRTTFADCVWRNNADVYWDYRQNPTSPPSSPPPAGSSRPELQPLPELPPAPVEKIGDLTFGSTVILNKCWPKENLEARRGEKKVNFSDPTTNVAPASRLKPQKQPSPLSPALRNSIRSVKPAGMKKVVALTFDLCERTRQTTGYDGEIVDYLRRHRIKATFFAGGKWMRSHPDRAKQLMADPLFEVGNHGWTHGNLRVLTGEAMHNQVDWTQAQYELLREELANTPCAQEAGPGEMDKIPQLPRLFRFPYGTCSPESLNYLASQGLAAIQWSIVSRDAASNQTPEGIAKIVRSQIKPGAIIIMHANGLGHGTAQALPLFIPALLDEGWTFVTVSELLSLGIPYAVEECYEENPGDNLHYDKKFGEGT